MNYHQNSQMRVYSHSRQRLYLNASERHRFAEAALKQEPLIRNLCLCLLYTGCRISEATHIRKQDIQLDEALVVINTLKKRNKIHLREVPLPFHFIEYLRTLTATMSDTQTLWSIDRVTAWRWIKAVMLEADIHGQHASPKGLRHSFGINAVMHSTPLNVLQKWMGHADMKTTAIYAQAQGPEERQLAKRMW